MVDNMTHPRSTIISIKVGNAEAALKKNTGGADSFADWLEDVRVCSVCGSRMCVCGSRMCVCGVCAGVCTRCARGVCAVYTPVPVCVYA